MITVNGAIFSRKGFLGCTGLSVVTSSPSFRKGLPTFLQVTLVTEERFGGISRGYFVAPRHLAPYSGEFLAAPDGASCTSIEPRHIMTRTINLPVGHTQTKERRYIKVSAFNPTFSDGDFPPTKLKNFKILICVLNCPKTVV